VRDRQNFARFPFAGLPACFADRALISHRGVGAFAPASLSDAVYRFEAVQVSSRVMRFFYLFYKSLKWHETILSGTAGPPGVRGA